MRAVVLFPIVLFGVNIWVYTDDAVCIEYCHIDGSTAHEDRIAAIVDYNKPGSEKFIFLLTTRRWAGYQPNDGGYRGALR